MEVPATKLTETRKTGLPVPEVSEEDAPMALAQDASKKPPPVADGGSDWETAEGMAESLGLAK